MLLDNEVRMKWSYRNKEHFISKGYVFTKINDVFLVRVEDLTTGSPIRVRVKCDYCGEEYTCYYYAYCKSHVVLNKDACKHCAATKTYEVSKSKIAKEKFDKLTYLFQKRGYELITTINEYDGAFMKIKYICPKHGEQVAILDNLLKGCGCNSCGREVVAEKLSLNDNVVKEYIEQFNDNILLNCEEYKNELISNLKIQCGNCGNVYITSLASYRNTYKHCCPQCTIKSSDGEEIIRQWLIEHNIEFEPEKRFKDCKDKYTLPFDFYLPKFNMCIEFDGKQHYDPCYGMERLKNVQYHDSIKNNYCANNGIKLLRIPYWRRQHIKYILEEILN